MPRPPGFLSSRIDPEVVMMICTAGHVDHGKTKLVKLLTGCETDRLKEEQERGMTIELGFAPCYLGGGNLCVGIVDVPGHEKFIRNMAAGVSGIELAVLVIAADDGVMPQTIEHVQILELLGVNRAMVALTKIDLVDPELVALREEEVREFLSTTPMANAPICPVSSETFEGFPHFYETLVGLIKSIQQQRASGIFRMPIERVFSRPGFGSVVTGIPIAGTIAIGDEVELVPGNQRGRVRGIQRFQREANEGGQGQCLALNIPDFSKVVPARGQILCAPGYVRAGHHYHVQLKTVPNLDPPLKNAEAIRLHTGSAEVQGKIYLHENGLASIAVAEPIAAVPLDRYIFRRLSPAVTIGGGLVLEVTHEAQRPRSSYIAERLKAASEAIARVDLNSDEGMVAWLLFQLKQNHGNGASILDLSRAALIPVQTLKDMLPRLIEDGMVLQLADDFYLHVEAKQSRIQEVLQEIQRLLSSGNNLSLNAVNLRKGLNWPDPLWRMIENELVAKGLLKRVAERTVVRQETENLPPEEQKLLGEIVALYKKTGFHSPRPEEVPDLLKAPAARVNKLLQFLCNEHALIRLSPLVVLHYDAFKQAQDRVVQIIKTNGSLDSADFKQEIQSSRKYALAILDFLDNRRVTLRFDSVRKLAPDFEKRLL